MTRTVSPRQVVAAVLMLGLTCLAGCGGTYDSSVQGAVTLDGNRLTRGTVAYHPVAGGPAAYARIDDDGTYAVRTGRETGLPSGEYQVTVVANEPPAKRDPAAGPPPPGKPIAPIWYRTKDTSGLRYTIEPGNNEINIELSSAVPAGWSPYGQR